MKILITGGSGFIGRALAPRLRAAGHTVSVLSRKPPEARAVTPPPIRVINALEQAGDIDAVVNLAGENIAGARWTAARKAALRQSRIDTTRALVDWMDGLTTPPKVLVSGSAIGYYGSHGDEPLTEASPSGDDFPAELCRDWEREAVRAEALGVRVCRLRTGVVLGPHGGALAQMLPPFRMGLGGPTGEGGQWMSWVHRDDLCALIEWLLQNPEASGAWNGTAPQPVTNAEFTSTLARTLHRPSILRTPAPLLRLAFGEMAELLLLGQRVLPERAEMAGFQFRFPRVADAFADVLTARHD